MDENVATANEQAHGRRARGRPSEGAREALVDAARELFAEQDFNDVSTEALLAHAGVSRGAMYHHFPSKTGLFRAAWEASERDLLLRLASRAQATSNPFDALRAGCLAYLEESASNRELQRIGLRQSRAVLGWEGWSEAAAELGIGVMQAGVQAAVDAGEIETAGVNTLTRILLAALIEAALLIATAPDPEAALAEVAPEAMRMVDGLRSG